MRSQVCPQLLMFRALGALAGVRTHLLLHPRESWLARSPAGLS
jgi:hypothetical protein